AALGQTEPDTLRGLLRACRSAEQDLGGNTRGVGGSVIAILFLVFLAVVGGWHLSQIDTHGMSLPGVLRSLWQSVRTSPTLALVLAMPFALFLPAYLLT